MGQTQGLAHVKQTLYHRATPLAQLTHLLYINIITISVTGRLVALVSCHLKAIHGTRYGGLNKAAHIRRH